MGLVGGRPTSRQSFDDGVLCVKSVVLLSNSMCLLVVCLYMSQCVCIVVSCSICLYVLLMYTVLGSGQHRRACVEQHLAILYHTIQVYVCVSVSVSVSVSVCARVIVFVSLWR